MAEVDKVPKAPPRKDGRRPFMIYLDPGLIKDIKRAALEADRTACEIVEEQMRLALNAPPHERGKRT
ncbi:hypothetical protein [Devosia psychrophila]|uniref:hypothetical protein n=1 Tax=Devosia psychrophila TaxID=728005 RepID=UPI001FCCEA62|nr:hypothetical protein [Devosia psychrophila]